MAGRAARSGSATPTPSSPGAESPFGNHEWPPRPGSVPRFDSTYSNASARYPLGRRGSTASTVSSIGGMLDTSSAGGSDGRATIRDLGHNAISTLLQPPIVRTGLVPHTALPASATHRPPSTRDIPPVTLTNIPHVDPTAFKTYLSQVGPLYEARQQTEGEDTSQLGRRSRGTGAEDDGDRTLSRAPSRQNSVSVTSPLESPTPVRRRSSGGIPRLRPAVTPLSTIPSVYFDENFHLENPRTFDVVSERSEVLQTPQSVGVIEEGKANGSINGVSIPIIQQPRKALATNAILQEKLSWYLDTVEIHLISSISTASKSFFAALGSLKELHSEAVESVTQIKKLREDLGQLDQQMALGGLEVVAMKQRRQNLGRLADATEQLRCVIDGAAHCEGLVQNGDLERALDRIAALEEFTCGSMPFLDDMSWLCTGKPRQLLDLRRLKCLDGFSEGMDQLRDRIGRDYEARFIDALLSDLRKHIDSVSNTETLRRWASSSQRSRGQAGPGLSGPPAYLQTSTELRKNLSSILDGLSRSKYTPTASRAFWDEVMREMKSLIRKHLPSSSDDDASSTISTSTNRSRTSSRAEKSAILARNLQALSPEDAEELFTKVYCAVGEALRRLQTQVKLLLDVTSGSSMSPPGSPPGSPPAMQSIDKRLVPMDGNLQEQLSQALDMSSLLGQAVDIAQTQVTKVLRVRSERTAKMPLQMFLRYFTLNRLFADECEAVTGRSGAALRAVVDGQIKDFISQVASAEMQELAEVMEGDRWDAKDFDDDDDKALQQLLQAVESDPEDWLKKAWVWEPLESATAPPAALQNGTTSIEAAASTNGTSEQQDPASTASSKPKTPRPAHLNTEPYLLTPSSTHLLHLLIRLSTLLATLPSKPYAPDVSAAITDSIRLFTSRTNQLVLFAGATRSKAALERINTKHLALASRGLGFAAGLLPYLREFVRRKIGPSASTDNQDGKGNVVNTFNSVLRGTANNQLSVHEKMVNIMGARSRAHAVAMRKVQFDAEGEGEGEAGQADGKTSAYMATLIKETTTLHRVLSRHLPEQTVEVIMRQVFEQYAESLGEAAGEVALSSEAGRRRFQRDFQLFTDKLGAMPGATETGDALGKKVAEKALRVQASNGPNPHTQQQQQQQGQAQAQTTGAAQATNGAGENNGDGAAA